MFEVRQRPFDAKFVQLESADLGRSKAEYKNAECIDRFNDKEYNKIAGMLHFFSYEVCILSNVIVVIHREHNHIHFVSSKAHNGKET